MRDVVAPGDGCSAHKFVVIDLAEILRQLGEQVRHGDAERDRELFEDLQADICRSLLDTADPRARHTGPVREFILR